MTEDSSKKMLAFFAGVVAAAAIMGLALFFVMENYNTQIDALNAEITELKSQTTDTLSGEASDESANIDETEEWETYTNSTYGFSFKYPSSWSLERGVSDSYPNRIVSVKSNEPNKNKIWPQGSYYYDQMIINKESKNSITDWIEERLAGGVEDNSKVVTINGSQYTEIIPGSDPDYLAELKVDDGNLFSIIFDWADSRDDISQTQEQILSTLQFAD